MVFMKCETCDNIISFLRNSGVIPQCCGKPMKQLIPGISDGEKEKHVPVMMMVKGNKENNKCRSVIVEVGENSHPMSLEHYINWIIIETDSGFKVRYLSPKDEPIASFALCHGEEVLGAYAYCNIHGLWYAAM